MDAGDQLVAVERLGDVIVGAETERADLGIHFADARQDQDRSADLRRADLLEHVIAVHVGQVQVEKDDVVIVELGEIEAFLAQIGRVDVEPFRPEHQLDALGGRRFVLDQQHSHRNFPPFRPRALRSLNGLEAVINHSMSEGKRLIMCNALDSLESLRRSHRRLRGR